MTYKISFYFQIAASITSIFILFKGHKKILSFIPIIFLIASFIFKPHLQGDNLVIAQYFKIGLDNKYFLLDFLFRIFGANATIFLIFQILASVIVLYLFYSLPKELLKDNLNSFKQSIHIPSKLFLIFNYIIFSTSKLTVHHPRQFLTNIILIYCVYQLYISQKQLNNIKISTLLFSIFASLVHFSGVISTLYFFYLYIKNNSFFSLAKIKTLSLKDTLLQRYINVILAIITVILSIFFMQFIFRSIILFISNYLGIGDYIRELDYYDRNIFGYTLPIINLIPITIYSSIFPFTNFFKKVPKDLNLKRYYFYLNLYSFSAIAIMSLEYSVNFYSIGRLKTLLIPLLFFLIFQIPKQNKSIFLKRSSLVIIYILSLFTVYRSYSSGQWLNVF